jgi:hypothetical protein
MLAIFVLVDVVFDETLGEVHNEERSFQSNGVFKVEVDEFIMQSQEEGEDSTVENTTNIIVENVKEGITNHEEPILVLRRSQREKKTLDRLITSMIVIEVTIDENLLLKPTSFEESMSTLNKIKWEETFNFEFHSLMQNETWTLTVSSWL